MNILSNYYGDIRVRMLGFILTLSSAFTCAWRDLTLHVGKLSVLWVQLSFWDEPSYSLKQKLAGVRLRVVLFGRGVCHFTILPMVPFLKHYKKPWDKLASRYNCFVWWFAKKVVDRRYSPLWEAYKKKDANRWAGVSGNALLEYKPRAIPAITIPEQLTAKLLGTLPKGRGCIAFQLCGVPMAQDWLKGWEERGKGYPYCDISLWIDNLSDIKQGASLGSFGGELWPSAWPEYFYSARGTAQCPVNVMLTQKGAELLQTALKV